MNDLKTGRNRNHIKELARLIINAFTKFDDLSIANLERSRDKLLLDEVISEMLYYNYIELDFDENSEVVIKPSLKRRVVDTVFEISNAIFQSSTNTTIQENYANFYGVIYFIDGCLYFVGRYDETIFRTSLLVKYEINGDTLTLNTLNSCYVFKLIKEMIINESILASQEKIDRVMEVSTPLVLFNFNNISELSREESAELLEDVRETYMLWIKDVQDGKLEFHSGLDLAFKREIEDLSNDCNPVKKDEVYNVIIDK